MYSPAPAAPAPQDAYKALKLIVDNKTVFPIDVGLLNGEVSPEPSAQPTTTTNAV